MRVFDAADRLNAENLDTDPTTRCLLLLAFAIPPWLAAKFDAPKWALILSLIPFGLLAMRMGDPDEHLLGESSEKAGKYLLLLMALGGVVIGGLAWSLRGTPSLLGVVWWLLPVALVVLAQSDVQFTAAHTYSSVSGQTTSWYTHTGGIQARAAHGPFSLRAHTDALELLAAQDVQVTSSSDEIRLVAKTDITLTAGGAQVKLHGADITMNAPGAFITKGATHDWGGGASAPVQIEALPQGLAGETPHFIELNYHDDDLKPLAGYPYRVVFDDGSMRTGTLDANGHARIEGVPNQAAEVFFGESLKPYAMPPASAVAVTDEALAQDLQTLGLDIHQVDLQALVQREAGRPA